MQSLGFELAHCRPAMLQHCSPPPFPVFLLVILRDAAHPGSHAGGGAEGVRLEITQLKPLAPCSLLEEEKTVIAKLNEIIRGELQAGMQNKGYSG